MDNSEKAERNKKLVLRYAAMMNALETTEGCEEAMRKYTDNETYIRAVVSFRNAFPDYTIYFEDLTAEGDFVIAHGIMRGTHMGEIFGLPATFRKIESPMMIKYQVINENIANAWPM